jgi:DNA-binding SARP family transcriptional activator/Tfp pilus assembly protein PilF
MRDLPTIKLLGTFALLGRSDGVIALPLKTQALVALLALQKGRPVKREVISEWLWPDRGEKQARNSLKQALYVLRRDGFGEEDAVKAWDDTLALHPEDIACDVHELQALLKPETQAPWQRIASLYSEPLLSGFPPISPVFDDFLVGMRRALEADVLDKLGQLEERVANSDLQQSIVIAERMWAIDPLREDTHRRLIQSFALAGRRTDAMRLYAEAKALLRREMDVAPAAETEAIIARIQHEGASPPKALAFVDTKLPASPGYNGPPRIAVLPLRQFLDRALPSHISDGVTADVISQLAGLRELAVISHGSTFDLRDPGLDPRQIGRKLDVRYLVVTHIRQVGDQFRLTTELTETEAGRVVYVRTDNAESGFLFADQDRVVGRLANALVPQVHETELRRIRGQRPESLSIYEKVLLIREHLMLLKRDSFAAARILIDEIIRDDPGYGEAYALAADWHGISAVEGWSTNRARDIAELERLARTALVIDRSNLRALVSYAYRRSLHYRDHAGAMDLFRQALDIAPSSAMAWTLSGCCMAFAGDAAEAIRRATRALELSPNDRESYKFFYTFCVAYYIAGDYEQAAYWGQKALVEKAVWRGAGGFTAASLSALGRLSQAREIAARDIVSSPERTVSRIVEALPFEDAARRMLYGQHLQAAGFPD